MIFVRSNYFEITLVDSRGDNFLDEVLICTIKEDFEVVEHVPVGLFLEYRNMAIIYGRNNNGECVSKCLMQVGTKKQEYAGWDPINTVEDFRKMVQKKISIEKSNVNSGLYKF